MPNNYADLVKQDESAVKAVKDPELKRVALEKILDDLLAGGSPSGDTPTTKRRASKKSAKSSTSTAKKKTSRGGPLAYIEELVEEGFFKKPKVISQAKAELENRGRHIPLTSMSGPMQKLCQRKKLRRQKTKGTGKKHTFSYSEW